MKKERSRRIPLRAWLMYLLLLCFSVSGVDRTYPIAPGADLSNDAAVHFGGSEMACYLFLQIDADGWTSKEDTFTYPDADRAWMTFSVADGWLPLPGYGTVFYRILPANTPLDAPVFSDGKITVSPSAVSCRCVCPLRRCSMPASARICPPDIPPTTVPPPRGR